MSQIGASIAFQMITVAELLRYFTWLYVLHSAAGYYLEKPYKFKLSNLLSPLGIGLIFSIAVVTLIGNDFLISFFHLRNPVIIQIGWMLVFSVLGLLLVEQVVRNANQASRKSVSFLCISAGAIFGYDFFVFSNAFLVQSIDYEFWSTRGIVNILAIPTLLLAAVRNPRLAPEIHVSRTFVFHSTTLLGVGAYLTLMAVVGFYVKESSGEWGKLIQASFFFASLLVLLVLFFSPRIKTRIKRYLTYSFRNKYDYRDEWNRFSQTLLMLDPNSSIFQRSIQAIGQIVDSQGGSLWVKDNNQYVFKSNWKLDSIETHPVDENSVLIQMINSKKGLFTTDELSDQLNLADRETHWIAKSANSWLILPLWVNDEPFGFIHLEKSIINIDLDIEDIDLLNIATHHVALALFSNEADAQVQQSKRFKDLNQMTAFLVHDLKTVFSQLSLLVENADKHKSNPEFIDDMINTVHHTTQKMERLLSQLRDPGKDKVSDKVSVISIIQDIVDSYQHHPVKLSFNNNLEYNPFIMTDTEQLKSAIKHIIQNGVEAVGKVGAVSIVTQTFDSNNVEIKIEDNGKGMSQQFIAEGLFEPFKSTKGVSGMGVGVYQCREFLRSIGGDIKVKSQQGVGTCFTINFPVEYE
jgi:putative PEP-CTERM system histidine kinase